MAHSSFPLQQHWCDVGMYSAVEVVWYRNRNSLIWPKECLASPKLSSFHPRRCMGAVGSRKVYFGGGGSLEPLFHPPFQGPAFFHVFHAYSMTKPLSLSLSLCHSKGGVLWLPAVLIHPCRPPPPPHEQVGAKIFTYLH